MSHRIGLGLATLPLAGIAAPEQARLLLRFAVHCEALGIDSLWQSDRLVGRDARAPHPEALAVMAALAGATSRIKFGMNAVVVGTRDPLVLAAQCATIDWLSGGRLLPVFGVGNAHAPEWAASGRSPRGRGRRADEALELMRRLWSEERVDFEGETLRVEGAALAPRPLQQPLPLWIGGASPAAVRRTARVGSGWLGGLQSPAQVAPVVEAIRAAAASAGRSIDADHFGATFPFRLGRPDDAPVQRALRTFGRARGPGAAGGPAESWLAVGGADEVIAHCDAYRRAGVCKYVLLPLAEDERDLFEQTRRLAAEVMPVVHAWR